MEEDFMTMFEKEQDGVHFTKLPAVMGRGFSEPKLGDSVWPQLNMMFVIYCSKEMAVRIHDIVEQVRKLYPHEGIACFKSKAKIW